MSLESDAVPQPGETVVAIPMWEHALISIGFPLLGAGAGWLLRSIAGWVASLAWAPFQGPFKLVASLPEPQRTIAALLVGAGAGLVLAYLAARESLTVTVADDQITFTRGESTRIIKRAAVDTVFLDGKQLVLLDPMTAELAREASDLSADQLRAALLAHGYPWLADGDPHKDAYRRWIEDTPDLPAGADALFKARARALEKGDNDDVLEFRTELARLGIVVRDEKKRQYWRRVEQHETSGSTL